MIDTAIDLTMSRVTFYFERECGNEKDE